MKRTLIIILIIIVLYFALAAFRYWMDSSNWIDKDAIPSQEKVARYAWFITHPFKSYSKDHSI